MTNARVASLLRPRSIGDCVSSARAARKWRTFAGRDAIFCAFTFRRVLSSPIDEKERPGASLFPPSRSFDECTCRTRGRGGEERGEFLRISATVSIYEKPIASLLRISEFKHPRLYTQFKASLEESVSADRSDGAINRVINGRLNFESDNPLGGIPHFVGNILGETRRRHCRIIDRRSQPTRGSRDSHAVNVQSRGNARPVHICMLPNRFPPMRNASFAHASVARAHAARGIYGLARASERRSE